jgi:hypothetical protein
MFAILSILAVSWVDNSCDLEYTTDPSNASFPDILFYGLPFPRELNVCQTVYQSSNNRFEYNRNPFKTHVNINMYMQLRLSIWLPYLGLLVYLLPKTFKWFGLRYIGVVHRGFEQRLTGSNSWWYSWNISHLTLKTISHSLKYLSEVKVIATLLSALFIGLIYLIL